MSSSYYCFSNKSNNNNPKLQAAGNGERQRMAGANGKPPPSPRKIYEFLNQHIIGKVCCWNCYWSKGQ